MTVQKIVTIGELMQGIGPIFEEAAVRKIEHGWTRKEQIRTDSICENLRNLRSDFH